MTLSKITVHGRRRWRLEYRVNGKRFRPTFDTKQEAQEEMQTLAGQRQAAGDVWLALTAQQRNEFIAVHAEAQEAGYTLRQIWQEFKAGGAHKLQAERPLEDAVTEFLTAKRSSGRTSHYLKCLQSTLGQFARGQSRRPVGQIPAQDIERFLHGRSAVDHKTKLSHLSAFLGFCVRRSYAQENPCQRVERVRLTPQPPRILTWHQCAKAVIYTHRKEPRFLAWLALSLFAGLRPEDAIKTPWSAIDTERAIVIVDAQASKVRKRRIVELQPTAVAWLKAAKAAGASQPLSSMTHRRFLRRLRERLGFDKWPQDVLRHTAATYLLAATQDMAKVSLWLDHSPGVMMRHYRELVTREAAEKFWSIRPSAKRPAPANAPGPGVGNKAA
jgi:integrase